MTLTFEKCTTVITAVLTVTCGLGFSFDKMVWYGREQFDFGLACEEPYDL
jgi:hypothetical protein